jgi:hypothetical protein
MWTYSKKQIEELFAVIQDREIEEINRTYNMIRVAMSKDAPEKFISKNADTGNKETTLGSVGIASEEEQKNHNPNLKLRR